MTIRVNLIVGLTIVLLALGATSSWAAFEFNALKEYDFFKFAENEADDWDQKVKNGAAEYECQDETDGCKMVAFGVEVGGNNPINIEYTCPEGAKLLLLPSGILLVPNACDGALA